MTMEAATGTPPPTKKASNPILRFLPLVLIAAGIAAILISGVYKQLSLETLKAHRETLTAFVEANLLLAAAIYFGVYVAATAFAIPGASFITITGGFLFGLFAGTALTVTAATIGAVALFLAARSAIGGALRKAVGPFLGKIESGFNENSFSYMFSMRFIPIVPFFVANIAPAVLGAKLRDYVITTFFGIMPGTFAYTWIGAGLGASFDQGKTPDLGAFAAQLTPAFAAIGVVSLLPALIKRLTRKKTA